MADLLLALAEVEFPSFKQEPLGEAPAAAFAESKLFEICGEAHVSAVSTLLAKAERLNDAAVRLLQKHKSEKQQARRGPALIGSSVRRGSLPLQSSLLREQGEALLVFFSSQVTFSSQRLRGGSRRLGSGGSQPRGEDRKELVEALIAAGFGRPPPADGSGGG